MINQADIIIVDNLQILRILIGKKIGNTQFERISIDDWNNLADESYAIVSDLYDTKHTQDAIRDNFDFENTLKQDSTTKGLKDQYLDTQDKIDAFDNLIRENRNILKDTDVYKEFKVKTLKKPIYDSFPLFDDQNLQLKTDNAYIKYLKDRIYESKLTFGCGLVLVLDKINFEQLSDKFIKIMGSGLKIAMITEGGKTLDPNFSSLKQKILKLSQENNLPVESVPGASLVTYTLSQSGFPSDSFSYHGELVGSKISRINQLSKLCKELKTVVIRAVKHSSSEPDVLLRSLSDIKEVYGGRQEVYVGINICVEGKERKIRGEVADMINVFKDDPVYKVNEILQDEYLVIISPNTFEYNRGKLIFFNLIFSTKNKFLTVQNQKKSLTK